MMVEEYTIEVELKLDRDFDSYSQSDQERLTSILQNLLGMEEEVIIKKIRKGSTLVTIQLPMQKAQLLHRLYKSGKLDIIDVIAVSTHLIHKGAYSRLKEFHQKSNYESGIPNELINENLNTNPLQVIMIMYQPEILVSGKTSVRSESTITKIFKYLPFAGLIIKNGEAFWRCSEVVLDIDTQIVEAHLIPINALFSGIEVTL